MEATNSNVDVFLDNLIKGSRAECSQLAKKYLSKSHSITELYEEVFKIALYKVGVLWEENEISVATEHMATAITEGILNELFEEIHSTKRVQKKVVVACVEDEQHQVGIKMVADSFEMHGWESLFLGTGIPTSELISFLHETNPDILAISLSVYYNYSQLLKMLKTLSQEFPELLILVGGQAFNHISEEQINQSSQVKIVRDLYELNQYIESLI